jgi:hypothetical protein
MRLRVLTFYGFSLLTGACSTVGEVLTEPSSAFNYERGKDDDGNTVFRRERVIHEGDDDDDSLAYSLVDLAQSLSYAPSSDSGMTLAQSNPGTVDLTLTEDKQDSDSHSGIAFNHRSGPSLFIQRPCPSSTGRPSLYEHPAE